MDNWADIFAPLVGRILMGGFFLWNGIEATLNFPSTVISIVGPNFFIDPVFFTIFALAVEVLCGIALIVGLWSRPASLILVVFVIIAAFAHPALDSTLTQALYLQDMAIIGGLLYVSAYGAGSWSPNWKFKRYGK